MTPHQHVYNIETFPPQCACGAVATEATDTYEGPAYTPPWPLACSRQALLAGLKELPPALLRPLVAEALRPVGYAVVESSALRTHYEVLTELRRRLNKSLSSTELLFSFHDDMRESAEVSPPAPRWRAPFAVHFAPPAPVDDETAERLHALIDRSFRRQAPRPAVPHRADLRAALQLIRTRLACAKGLLSGIPYQSEGAGVLQAEAATEEVEKALSSLDAVLSQFVPEEK